MEQVKKFYKNCVIGSNDDNTYIRQWTDEWTTNTTLEIAPFPLFPHMNIDIINATHYQWCGPMLLIAKYLGKFTKCRIKINKFEQNFGIISKSLFDGTTAIALNSIPSYIYVTFVIDRNMSSLVKLTPYITFIDSAQVLAITKKGKFIRNYHPINLFKLFIDDNHFFKPIECFDSEVYYCIIASIIVISGVISGYRKSVKIFISNFWSYSSVLINGSYKLDQSCSLTMILSSNWLLMSVILMASFSGMLKDLFIKPRPILWVDTWDDLVNWKELKLQTTKYSSLVNFIGKNPDHYISKEIVNNERLKLFETSLANQNLDKISDFDGVMNGKVALVFPSQYLHVLKNNLIVRGLEEDIDFHISKNGDTLKSCFVFYSQKNMNNKQILKFYLL